MIAIGDIHGQADMLGDLLGRLTFSDDDTLIFVGDYIDRGPDAPGVVERLISLSESHPRCVFLRGNHDAMLLHFLGLEPEGYGDSYLLECNGGATTLLQYGCPEAAVAAYFVNQGSLPGADMQRMFLEKFPEAHIEFFKATRLYYETPDFLFVHAGIAPGKSLDRQTQDDLLWIRREFIDHPHRLPQTVIYGHTPTIDLNFEPRWDIAERKIGIDTGAAWGGKLTALSLPDMEVVSVG